MFGIKKFTVLGVLGLGLLTACGGSSSADLTAEAKSIVAKSSDEVFTIAIDLDAKYEPILQETGLLEKADLPTTGRVDYAGAIALGPVGFAGNSEVSPSIIGQLNVNVNFAGNDIDGKAGNFFVISVNAGPVGGSLDLDAKIDETSGLFEGELTGTLINIGAVADGGGDIPVDITVQGGFTGDNAEALLGEGSGTVEFPLSTAPTAQDVYFITERE